MSRPHHEPIAIIGSACHFPGSVDSTFKLWSLLCATPELHCVIPNNRFDPNGFYHPRYSHAGHTNIKNGYILDCDLAAFDHDFFGIRRLEAEAMYPQQRLLLETVYECLEAAGLFLDDLKGNDTAVYVGSMSSDFKTLSLRDPDTCSSSLVALHLAVQGLRSGDSRLAAVCGTNLIIGPDNFIMGSKLGMLSPDGDCKMWDKHANGYARGEGMAVIFLKPLSMALADGDHIEYGASNGLTAPSAAAQQDLIRRTYSRAGLNPLERPEDLPQYFETHGTGTPTGDPIEAEAIKLAFFDDGDHARASTKFPYPSESSFPGVKCWPQASISPQSQPRRVSVNSFGFGGTNALSWPCRYLCELREYNQR
ncbi:thiolase-like protein [Xylaria cf. heliscus]|nr:thiolase-like protein [Xylaria cf. heliscus]